MDRFRAEEVPTLDSILETTPPHLGHLRYGGRDRRTRLLCGGFALTEVLPARLLAVLPPVLRLDARSLGASGVAGLLDLVRAEADDLKAGATALFAKIADVFLTQALRT